MASLGVPLFLSSNDQVQSILPVLGVAVGLGLMFAWVAPIFRDGWRQMARRPSGPKLLLGGWLLVVGVVLGALLSSEHRGRPLGETVLEVRVASAEEPPPRRRRVLWSIAAGLGACAVGLFWGRWLEGDRASASSEEDDDEQESNS